MFPSPPRRAVPTAIARGRWDASIVVHCSKSARREIKSRREADYQSARYKSGHRSGF